jgi:HAD superfamily hydrolase (TIGR01509 family)
VADLFPLHQRTRSRIVAGCELVIFDCDGVLVDSERLTVSVEAEVLTDMGWPMTSADIVRDFMGKSDAANLAQIANRLGQAAADDFDRVTTERIRRSFVEQLTAIEGVRELVDALHLRSLATCVASSGTHSKMEFTLGITGLIELFRGRIFSASEVERGKPEPDLFLYAAKQMQAAPSDCVVIEDSVQGVLAGVAAGMRVFGYAGGLTPEIHLRDAGAEVFHHMAELSAILTRPI